MKFSLFIFALCIGYFLFFQPSDIPVEPAPAEIEQESIRNHESESLFESIPWGYVLCIAAIWAVVRYVKSTGSARTIWQGSSRTKARNAMHNYIKGSDEKVTNAIRGSDELGDFEAIGTKDPFGNEVGYWTEDVDKYPK